MPLLPSILKALAIHLIYLAIIAGLFTILRQRKFQIAGAAALSIILGLLFISLSFQFGLLIHFPAGGMLIVCIAAILSIRLMLYRQLDLRSDVMRLIQVLRESPTLLCIAGASISFSYLKLLVLPIVNFDAQVYHLTRIFHFVQNSSLNLDQFSRYHQAVLPYGSDVLFLPFVVSGAMRGYGIISWLAYIAIGAATYQISRDYTSPKRARIAGFIALSFPLLILQSASVKNDIVMAAVAVGALLLCSTLRDNKRGDTVFITGLLALLCAFGTSVKPLFAGFIPGFFMITACYLGLYRPNGITRYLDLVRHKKLLFLGFFLASVFAAQPWLYIQNIFEFGGWSGPPAFKEMHLNQEGLIGAFANVIRYSINIFDIEFIPDRLLGHALGHASLSDIMTVLYQTFLYPLFGDAGLSGMEKEYFVIRLPHEDFSWCGLMGAFVFFVAVPFSVLRNPRILVWLSPALIYFMILVYQLGWMQWNNRFFSAFFICLVPALAYTLNALTNRMLLKLLTIMAAVSMVTTNLIDFAMPTLSVRKVIVGEEHKSPKEKLKDCFSTENSAWMQLPKIEARFYSEIEHLLEPVPEDSHVGLYISNHNKHFKLLMAGHHLQWQPLYYIKGVGEINPTQAFNIFFKSNMPYLIYIGPIGVPGLEPYLLRANQGMHAYLFKNPNIEHSDI